MLKRVKPRVEGAQQMVEMEHMLNVHMANNAKGACADFLGFMNVLPTEATGRISQVECTTCLVEILTAPLLSSSLQPQILPRCLCSQSLLHGGGGDPLCRPKPACSPCILPAGFRSHSTAAHSSPPFLIASCL